MASFTQTGFDHQGSLSKTHPQAALMYSIAKFVAKA
jgi:hypothetical protein